MEIKIRRIIIDNFIFKQQEKDVEKENPELGKAALSFETLEEIPDNKKIIRVTLHIDLTTNQYDSEAELLGIFELNADEFSKLQDILENTTEDGEIRKQLEPILNPLINKFRTYVALFSEEALNYIEIPNIIFDE